MRYDIKAPFLERLKSFGLDSPSSKGSGTVGDRIAREQAARIHERAVMFVGLTGVWQMNAESTARRKGFNAPNWDTGEMVSEEHIAGVVVSTHDVMEMTYGKGNHDEHGVTDRDRARFAHGGQSRARIKRPFFGLTAEDRPPIVETVREELAAHRRGG